MPIDFTQLTYSAITVLFNVIIVVFGEFLYLKCRWQHENARKFIHIGVCHWWIVTSFLVESLYYALLPTILFTFLNYASYRWQLVKSIERQGGKQDLGTVYYALSLFILVLMSWENSYRQNAALIAILILGYGDGLAAITGKNWGRITFSIMGSTKSIVGCTTMFIASCSAAYIVLRIMNHDHAIYLSIQLAIVATLLEAFTPKGFDNLSVPLITYVLVLYPQFVHVAILSLFAVAIVALAHQKKSLTTSGAIAALIVGSIIAFCTREAGLCALLLFFVSSSLLSHICKKDKRVFDEKFAKTSHRDAYQVFANGGVGVIFAFLYFLYGENMFFYAVIASFAAANADTWATELGVLNKGKPLCLRKLSRVPKGTSGAVSAMGFAYSFLGALFVAVPAVYIYDNNNLQAMFIISCGGLLGSVVDSLCGAFLQAVYCNDKGEETEKEQEQLIRGFRWVNNEVVNILGIILGSIFVILLLR
ncbi:DUF92 domain-containing protein [Candidatus Uabimicrobium amorphum]|uniref:Membrane protein n=1 Tax=Uabimicrobium amorphum TaxID=2596890 RepID=A0A5S9IS54_UABAM|nr:DUF92 domain-containing protein [Candidatus Uabimicrobium amorphum]BBM86727.1 membrane protein [Candidatus Uabimicrobium amorphum]